MCQETPRAQRRLSPGQEAPTQARQFLRDAGCVTHHAEIVEDAVLLVSELVTNSVLHGGPPVVVARRLRRRGPAGAGPGRLVGAAGPAARRPGDEGGRGLALVDTLSSDWGVDPQPDGKHVWFVLR